MHQRQRDQPLRSRGGRRRSIRQLLPGGRRQQPCARVYGPAKLVFGQGGSFTSAGCDSDTTNSNSTSVDLCSPTGLALDGSGNLYVADTANNRVLEFNT